MCALEMCAWKLCVCVWFILMDKLTSSLSYSSSGFHCEILWSQTRLDVTPAIPLPGVHPLFPASPLARHLALPWRSPTIWTSDPSPCPNERGREREREKKKEEWLLAAGSFMVLSAKCSFWIITSYPSPDNIDICVYIYIMCVSYDSHYAGSDHTGMVGCGSLNHLAGWYLGLPVGANR